MGPLVVPFFMFGRPPAPRMAEQAAKQGITPEEVEKRQFAPDAPRSNAICRMVDASEIANVATFLASDKAWAICGELVVATGGAGKSVYY